MRPHRAIHALTSRHREPGGLRRLDFFIDRADAWAGEKERSTVSVLVMGWEHGNVALPFATAGYRITVLESDATTVEAARATGAELGLTVEAIQGSVSVLGNRTFDIIVADFIKGSSSSFESFAELSTHLAADGMLLIAVPNVGENARFRDFQSNLKGAGWRLHDARGAGVFFSGLLPAFVRMGWKKAGGLFHAFDAADGWLADHWPLRFADGWLAELDACDPGTPYVMHLLPTLGIGGAERLVYELTARLPARGYQAKAVAIIDGGAMEKNFREQGIPLEIFVRRDPFGFSTFRDLSRLFFLQRPDIVHTHLFGADAWGRLAAFWQRVPVVVSTEHNINPSYGRIKRFVNRLFAMKTSGLIAVSDTVKKVMIEQDGVPEKKIRTIVNGINLDAVIARGARPFHDLPRLISVGRLYAQKDHATILKALALVKRPWRLRIVGAGPLEHQLRALAERLGIASRVEWLGARDDVPQLLAASDIFLFPSRWEGLGLAALEAAAAGVPIIASDLPPLREVLSANDISYVTAGDVPAWSHAIQAFLDDPVAAVANAARAVPRVRAKASIDAMVAAYADLYHALLAARRPKV